MYMAQVRIKGPGKRHGIFFTSLDWRKARRSTADQMMYCLYVKYSAEIALLRTKWLISFHSPVFLDSNHSLAVRKDVVHLCSFSWLDLHGRLIQVVYAYTRSL